MSDNELLTRFQRTGRPSDLVPLYQRYAELIYGWCLRYLTVPQRAEDAGAEIFTELLRKLPKHEVTNFRAWLQTLVRNHCLMQLRREKRNPVDPALSLMHSGEWEHLRREETTAPVDTRPLHRCLKVLRAEQRQCIRLFYLTDGASYGSVAAQLNLSVGQVRSHLQNGRRNLKICLEGPQPIPDPRAH